MPKKLKVSKESVAPETESKKTSPPPVSTVSITAKPNIAEFKNSKKLSQAAINTLLEKIQSIFDLYKISLDSQYAIQRRLTQAKQNTEYFFASFFENEESMRSEYERGDASFVKEEKITSLMQELKQKLATADDHISVLYDMLKTFSEQFIKSRKVSVKFSFALRAILALIINLIKDTEKYKDEIAQLISIKNKVSQLIEPKENAILLSKKKFLPKNVAITSAEATSIGMHSEVDGITLQHVINKRNNLLRHLANMGDDVSTLEAIKLNLFDGLTKLDESFFAYNFGEGSVINPNFPIIYQKNFDEFFFFYFAHQYKFPGTPAEFVNWQENPMASISVEFEDTDNEPNEFGDLPKEGLSASSPGPGSSLSILTRLSELTGLAGAVITKLAAAAESKLELAGAAVAKLTAATESKVEPAAQPQIEQESAAGQSKLRPSAPISTPALAGAVPAQQANAGSLSAAGKFSPPKINVDETHPLQASTAALASPRSP